MYLIEPIFLEGLVVKGFGRGSKQLGYPTANFSENAIESLPKTLRNGVYFGFANLDAENKIYRMVANLGYCPFFQNTQRSFETHILHDFPTDFYGSLLKVAIIDYIREERNFTSIG
ncbi:unnamed protein product [Gordionus sp. m RMFG-2023]